MDDARGAAVLFNVHVLTPKLTPNMHFHNDNLPPLATPVRSIPNN